MGFGSGQIETDKWPLELARLSGEKGRGKIGNFSMARRRKKERKKKRKKKEKKKEKREKKKEKRGKERGGKIGRKTRKGDNEAYY